MFAQKSDLATTVKINKTNCHIRIITDMNKYVKIKYFSRLQLKNAFYIIPITTRSVGRVVMQRIANP